MYEKNSYLVALAIGGLLVTGAYGAQQKKDDTAAPQKSTAPAAAPVASEKNIPAIPQSTDNKAAVPATNQTSSRASTVIIPADAFLIDTIKVVLHTQEGTDVITQSEADRPTLEGNERTLDDLVFERLMYQDAKKFKMMPDEETIDKHLKAVQRENNLTMEQLKAVFKSAGYTYEEGREQFGIMNTIRSILDFKIRSNLIVPKKLIQQYYDEHPVTQPAAYFIEQAFITIPEATILGKGVLKSKIEKYLLTGNEDELDIVWSLPFWVKVEDLAADRQFITGMAINEISQPLETDGGFELLRLKDKKPEQLVSLEERYSEIADILVKPKYQQLMDEYQKQLFDTAAIIYY